MNKKHLAGLLILITSILISGCNTGGQSSPPTATADWTTSPVDMPTLLPTDTPTLFPTDTPTLAPTHTSTPVPTNTPLPPVTVAFYHLRIEYTTTSDWANLEFANPEGILTMRLISVTGTPTIADASAGFLHLSRPVEALAIEPTVSMVVDLAMDPAAVGQPLSLISGHGAIGGSGIRVSYVTGQEATLLAELNHYWFDQSNPDTSATNFEVALDALADLPATERTLQTIAPPRMVWAFYYPWIAWDQSAACTDHPATPYEFSNDGARTPETFARQIEQAQSAGIDGFIVSWVDDPTLNRNLSLLLDAAQERGFFIAIYLESTPDPNDRTVHPEILTEWLAFAIPEFGHHPAYMQVDGKPLIVVYNTGAAPLETWRAIFAGVEARGLSAAYMGMSYNLADLDVFVGLHQYSILGETDLASVFERTSRGVRYYSLLGDTDQGYIFAATVQPGFDDCPYHPPTTELLVERSDGEYYRSTFEAAIASDPDWIFITSWNEFGETTHIEPSEAYGTYYLEMTRELITQWRGR